MCRGLGLVFVTLSIVITLIRIFTEFGRKYLLMLILTGLGSLIVAVYLIRKSKINRFQMIDDDNFTPRIPSLFQMTRK